MVEKGDKFNSVCRKSYPLFRTQYGVSYLCAGLADIFINPAYEKPDFKLILNQDGAKKNYCERNVPDFQ